MGGALVGTILILPAYLGTSGLKSDGAGLMVLWCALAGLVPGVVMTIFVLLATWNSPNPGSPWRWGLISMALGAPLALLAAFCVGL